MHHNIIPSHSVKAHSTLGQFLITLLQSFLDYLTFLLKLYYRCSGEFGSPHVNTQGKELHCPYPHSLSRRGNVPPKTSVLAPQSEPIWKVLQPNVVLDVCLDFENEAGTSLPRTPGPYRRVHC